MNDFAYQNKTKIVLGRGAEERLGEEALALLERGDAVLLHHSGGHALRSGIVYKLNEQLEKCGLRVFELSGVVPNPRVSLAQRGIELCKEQGIKLIVAVGGGSAIDSAKCIAVGALYEGDVWDFYSRKLPATRALPIGTVVTLPASGSENSTSSVMTNEALGWKQGLSAECIRPAFSLLNPELTYSLPAYQTACGVVDMMAHIMERYFSRVRDTDLTDELCEGAMRTILRAGRKVLTDGEGNSYAHRAELMAAACLAHNNLLGLGREGDWLSHHIEHELSAKYDIAHGAGLAIVFPAWMHWSIREDMGKRDEYGRPLNYRLARFAQRVFGVDDEDADSAAWEGLRRLSAFYVSIGMPLSFSDANMEPSNEDIAEMAQKVCRFGPDGVYHSLGVPQIEEIFQLMS